MRRMESVILLQKNKRGQIAQSYVPIKGGTKEAEGRESDKKISF